MLFNNVLAYRNFRTLWLGQTISQLGDAFYILMFAYMARKLSGSPAMVGYVGVVEALPFLVLSPYAGVLADRLNRRTIMLLADCISFVILIVMAGIFLYVQNPSVELIFVAGPLLSVVNAFFVPAKNAAIPSLVPKESRWDAFSLSSATEHIAPLLGISLLTVVLWFLGDQPFHIMFSGLMIANAITFMISALCIHRLPSLKPKRKHQNLYVKTVLDDIREGIHCIWNNKFLRVALALTLLQNLFVAPFMMLYVEVNEQWFGGQPIILSQIEWLYAVALAVGGLVLGKAKTRRPGMWFISGMFLIGFSTAAMAFSKNLWPFIGCNTLFGFGFPLAAIPLNNYIQVTIPTDYRGRVNSALNMLSQGIMPLGMGIAAISIHVTGLVGMFLIMGAGMCFAAVVGTMNASLRTCKMPIPGTERTVVEPELQPTDALAISDAFATKI